MKVTSTGIANGYWEDRFGKFGTELSAEGTPLRSIPFKIEDAPEGTVSFAVVLDDVDAIPVCGFTWFTGTVRSDRHRAAGRRQPARSLFDSGLHQLPQRGIRRVHRRSIALRRHGTSGQGSSVRSVRLRAGLQVESEAGLLSQRTDPRSARPCAVAHPPVRHVSRPSKPFVGSAGTARGSSAFFSSIVVQTSAFRCSLVRACARRPYFPTHDPDNLHPAACSTARCRRSLCQSRYICSKCPNMGNQQIS